MSITVANEEKLCSTAKCNKLKWTAQGLKFHHDLRVLPLGGYDMVLGVDWVKNYSPFILDFNDLALPFEGEI